MKTIEYLAAEKYTSQMELPAHKQIPAQNFIDWAQFGAREAQRWISIDDQDNSMPKKADFLIKFEDGTVRRFDEDWVNEFGSDGTVTHWRPIERI